MTDKVDTIKHLMKEIKEEFCQNLEGKTLDIDDLYGGNVGSMALMINPDIYMWGLTFSGVTKEGGDYETLYHFEPGFDRDAVGWYTSAEYAQC